MAGYFGAGLEGALQGYSQALSNQPTQVARILALRGEMQKQAILNKQLQDQQMAAQALLSYYGTPQTPAPSMPSGAPAPSPGQASVPSVVATGNMPSWAMPQPSAQPATQPAAPAQGVGPAGIMPYKSMSDIVQEVRQRMPGASPGAIMAAAGQIAKGEQLSMTAQERMLAQQSLDEYRRAELAFRNRTGQAPVVKEFREGGDIVTKQWNPATHEWDELSRGPSKGISITIPPDPTKSLTLTNKLRSERDRMIAPVEQLQQKITTLRGLLRSDSAVADQQISQLLADFVQKGRQTNTLLAQNRNFGDLATRMAGMIGRFFTGRYTVEQRRQIAELADQMQADVTDPIISNISKYYQRLAKEGNINPSLVVTPNFYAVGAPSPQAPSASQIPIGNVDSLVRKYLGNGNP